MELESQRPKRQLIVETAFRLFKTNGFYATGVDLIMREAGVSKRTLYQYFSSKNELVVAVLGFYQAQYQQHIEALLDRQNRSPRANILAIFDSSKSWFGDVNFHGCLAVNAMGEFAGKDAAIELACQRFKAWELSVFRELASEVDADRGEILAYQLLVLLEGMAALAQVMKGPCPIDVTAMAAALLDSVNF